MIGPVQRAAAAFLHRVELAKKILDDRRGSFALPPPYD
jgi:hypothetical protein